MHVVMKCVLLSCCLHICVFFNLVERICNLECMIYFASGGTVLNVSRSAYPVFLYSVEMLEPRIIGAVVVTLEDQLTFCDRTPYSARC